MFILQYTVNVVTVGTSEICTVLKVRTSEICIETVKIELFQSSRLSKMTKSVDPDQTARSSLIWICTVFFQTKLPLWYTTF